MSSSLLRRLAALALVASTASPLWGQEPYLVKDIVPGIGRQLGSDPLLIQAGDRVFVFARTQERGRELWITDGTPEGTRLVRDLCPGACSSTLGWQWSLGDLLLFYARADEAGEDLLFPHLWASNGTWQGTVPLGAPPLTGLPNNDPRVGVLEDRGLFFFAAGTGEPMSTVDGLWVTDGTRAGTVGPLGLDGPDGRPLFPDGFSIGRGALVFEGFSSATGNEPWVTDGTEQGTRQLGDLVPGTARSVAGSFRRLPDATLFFSFTRSFPCEIALWRSDGTAPGTVPLLRLDNPDCGIVVSDLLLAGDAVYFHGRDGTQPTQLWRSDGTSSGTQQLTDFPTSALRAFGVASDDAVLFAVDDGVHGWEPWIADAGGARLVADVCPGPCSSEARPRAWLGGRFYFHADDGTHGTELWSTDGTAAGTRLVHDICPGSCASATRMLGQHDGRVFFASQNHPAGDDQELWVTSGGAAGAVRLTDFGPDLAFPPTSAFRTATSGDHFLFIADDGDHGREIWRTDGTPEGTGLAADIETRRTSGAGSDPALITPWGDRVLFFADEPDVGYQPWISDGTGAGTQRLGVVVDPDDQTGFDPPYAHPIILGSDALFLARSDLSPAGPLELWKTSVTGPPVRLAELPGSFSFSQTFRLGDRAVVFASRDSQEPGSLWVSDGTAAVTRRLRDLFLGGAAELGGRLYFGAADPATGEAGLWATDGTESGTVLIEQIAPPGSFPPPLPGDFARLGGRLLFAAEGATGGREPWISDGTAEGTRRLVDLVPGFDGSFPRSLTSVGDRVFFFAYSRPFDDRMLWTTDGTAEGTLPIAPDPGIGLSEPGHPQLAAAGGKLFFTVKTPTNAPDELWVSDGTAEGTGSLSPLFPSNKILWGVWSAGDKVRVAVGGLWETDGTLAGTRRILETSATEFAEAGSLLFFRGRFAGSGPELLALPLGPPEPCVADAETLCLDNGRFAVTVRWRDPRTGDEGVGGALPLEGSDRTGLFWFFDPDNVELVVKNLAAGPVNGYFWNFYGALSDVEYTIEVVDTATGRRVEYFNPGGEICGRGDTTAFPARPPVPLPVPQPAAAPVRSAPAAGSTGAACGGDPTDLCLLDDRFRVEVEWTDHRSGDSGVGVAVPGTERSGFFWFFDDQNIELVVKMLDGRTVNGRFWVFYGALSDVEYTITVTDTETQEQAIYHNPPGEICGRGDTAAF